MEVTQFTPAEGWVEADPNELLQSVLECVKKTVENLKSLDIDPADIKAVGICNQRETSIVWDKYTGKPLHNAIGKFQASFTLVRIFCNHRYLFLVWLDARTKSTVEQLLCKVQGNKDFLKKHCGLPISTYFSALKLRWLIDNIPEVSEAIQQNRCMFGTVDSWLIWVNKATRIIIHTSVN